MRLEPNDRVDEFYDGTSRKRRSSKRLRAELLYGSPQRVQTIGGQDVATFPFHHEEADWSFRATEAGFKNYVARDAREFPSNAVPEISSPIGSGDFSIDDPMRAYYHARSRALLARRHAKGFRRLVFFSLFYPATVLAYALICAVQSKQHVETSTAFVRGAIDGFTMKLLPPPPPLLDKNGVPAPSIA